MGDLSRRQSTPRAGSARHFHRKLAFWNDGKYLAIASRWHHGLGYVRWFNVKTGQLLERLSTPEAEKKKLKWAQNLTA